MAAPPAATGTRVSWMSRACSARLSSHRATPTMAPTYSRNVALTVNSVSSARPPSATPTPIATGRFRPVAIGCRVVSSGARRTSDLEELGFLVLEQLVDLGHVAVRQLVKLALRP